MIRITKKALLESVNVSMSMDTYKKEKHNIDKDTNVLIKDDKPISEDEDLTDSETSELIES